MASYSDNEKDFCVLQFQQNQPVDIIQQNFRTEFGKDPPSVESIGAWYAKFNEEKFNEGEQILPHENEGEINKTGDKKENTASPNQRNSTSSDWSNILDISFLDLFFFSLMKNKK